MQSPTIGCCGALAQARSHPPTHRSCHNLYSTGLMPVSRHCETPTQDTSRHDEAEGQPALASRVDVGQDGLHAGQDQGEAGSVEACECGSLRCSRARHPCQPRRASLPSIFLTAQWYTARSWHARYSPFLEVPSAGMSLLAISARTHRGCHRTQGGTAWHQAHLAEGGGRADADVCHAPRSVSRSWRGICVSSSFQLLAQRGQHCLRKQSDRAPDI